MVIRYRGKLTNDTGLEQMLNFVRLFAKNHGWGVMEWKDKGTMFAQKQSAKLPFERALGEVKQEGVILNIEGVTFLPLVVEKPLGILVWFFPMEEIEGDAWIATDNCFVVTDVVSTDTHIAICQLLKEIKSRFIPSLQVLDEGEYFDGRNRKRLEELRRAEKYRGAPPAMVAELQGVLQEAGRLENPFAKRNPAN